MEHRCSPRKPVSMDVVLNYRSLGLVRGQTKDVGVGGMFIKTGRIRLPVNAMVDVSVIMEGARGMRPFRTEAIVVHTVDGGIGLMFCDLADDHHTLLHELVYGHHGHCGPDGRVYQIH
ncbi:MAG: PilZ domain-containing protein [Candidatus Sedimenticola sp. PURPLELP]